MVESASGSVFSADSVTVRIPVWSEGQMDIDKLNITSFGVGCNVIQMLPFVQSGEKSGVYGYEKKI